MGLSKRERQVMDALFQLERATVSEVVEALGEQASYSAVRATLRVLEEKGHARHEADGPRYLYLPTVPQEKAKKAALSHLVGTFFNGSGCRLPNRPSHPHAARPGPSSASTPSLAAASTRRPHSI